MADWVLPYRGLLDVQRGTKAKCRVRIYEDYSSLEPGGLEPAEPVVVLTELSSNQGETIVSASEIIAGTLLTVLGEILDLSDYQAPIFICHYPLEITGSKDAYELMSFEELELREIVVERAQADDPASASTYRVIPAVAGASTYRPINAEMVRLLLGLPS